MTFSEGFIIRSSNMSFSEAVTGSFRENSDNFMSET